jgi:hypothetical protein
MTPRDLVNQGLDFWYHTNVLGKPFADWSTMPSAMKNVVNKVNEIWKMIEANAKNVTNIKNVIRSKAPAVAEAIDKLGFGRKHIGKELNGKLWYALKKMAKQRKGGDAFDDKLSSFGLKGLYDSQVKPKAGKIDSGVRTLYNAYAAIGDNADLIQSTVNAIPAAPQSAKDVIKTVTDAAKSGRQSGLGKKGKRAPSQRNMMVSKLMREEGLTLGEASKKVSAMLKKGGAL